jgi:hypothetical protein
MQYKYDGTSCPLKERIKTEMHLIRLMVFENKLLRKIFGPKWDMVKGEWRTPHS